MSVRHIDILDLPSLPNCFRNMLPLDSARMLTRGNPLGAVALIDHLNPRDHIYTAVSKENDIFLMGQVALAIEETYARLTFLAPAESFEPAIALLDHLAVQAGAWGALHVLAEVDEHSPAFKEFRRAEFSMYAWQRIWRLSAPLKEYESGWQKTTARDLPAIHSLYSQIVPALIQPMEAMPRKPSGLVCCTEDNIQAYVAMTSGPAGIWIQPLIHPDAAGVSEKLAALLAEIHGQHGRPVFICVRSYQAWLEAVLEELGAEAGPRQAVMIKHLAAAIKSPLTAPAAKQPAISVQPSTISKVEKAE